MTRTFTALGAALVTLVAIVTVALADPLDDYTQQGLIGERPDGFVGFVVDEVPADIKKLVDRINKPVQRFLSTFEDWFTWAVTFLPVLTGWMAVQHLLLPYTTMLALHILSVEILLIVLPFSKLFHAFTLFGSRWYNGSANARKGVPV